MHRDWTPETGCVPGRGTYRRRWPCQRMTPAGPQWSLPAQGLPPAHERPYTLQQQPRCESRVSNFQGCSCHCRALEKCLGSSLHTAGGQADPKGKQLHTRLAARMSFNLHMMQHNVHNAHSLAAEVR